MSLSRGFSKGYGCEIMWKVEGRQSKCIKSLHGQEDLILFFLLLPSLWRAGKGGVMYQIILVGLDVGKGHL